jgi:hypothetical protein
MALRVAEARPLAAARSLLALPRSTPRGRTRTTESERESERERAHAPPHVDQAGTATDHATADQEQVDSQLRLWRDWSVEGIHAATAGADCTGQSRGRAQSRQTLCLHRWKMSNRRHQVYACRRKRVNKMTAAPSGCVSCLPPLQLSAVLYPSWPTCGQSSLHWYPVRCRRVNH